MMGLIAMLATRENLDKLGLGLALALITILYSLILTIAVAIPFRTDLEKQPAELSADS